MIKLKEGQRVISEDGNEYIVEKGDLLESKSLQEGLRIETLDGDKYEITYVGQEKPVKMTMDIILKRIPVSIKKYIYRDNTGEIIDNDNVLEFELNFDQNYIEKEILAQIKDQLEDMTDADLVARGSTQMIGFTRAFSNYYA